MDQSSQCGINIRSINNWSAHPFPHAHVWPLHQTFENSLPTEPRLDFLRPRRDMLFPLPRWPSGPGGPQGERGCARSLGRYGDGKGWMRNESLLQAQWPERVILFLSALQLHLYLILTGLYPRAEVRSFTYTTRHVSHPQPHAQHKPCKRHSLTPGLPTNTHIRRTVISVMHACILVHHLMHARSGRYDQNLISLYEKL